MSVGDELDLEDGNWFPEIFSSPPADPRGGSVSVAVTKVGDGLADLNSLCLREHCPSSPCSVISTLHWGKVGQVVRATQQREFSA